MRHLQIQHYAINIKPTVDAALNSIVMLLEIGAQTRTNLPARVRMATLYAVAQSVKGRVANTCNLSEDYVGYATRYGHRAGDFSPLCDMTVTEVKAVVETLGLPKNPIEKPPVDGLCGKTDEENIGFTYEELDRYIRTGQIEIYSSSSQCRDFNRSNEIKTIQVSYFFM